MEENFQALEPEDSKFRFKASLKWRNTSKAKETISSNGLTPIRKFISLKGHGPF